MSIKYSYKDINLDKFPNSDGMVPLNLLLDNHLFMLN